MELGNPADIEELNMGGRGSSSGANKKPYGSEYRTLHKDGNIKFVQYKDSTAAKAPMETKTKGRVYVTVDVNGGLKYISYYDRENRRTKQIDLDRPHQGVLPHAHHGYAHKENDTAKGFANLTTEEKEMVDRVRRIWYNRHSK